MLARKLGCYLELFGISSFRRVQCDAVRKQMNAILLSSGQGKSPIWTM